MPVLSIIRKIPKNYKLLKLLAVEAEIEKEFVGDITNKLEKLV